MPEVTAIYGDLHKHRSSWRVRETSKTSLDMQGSWAQDSEPFYRCGLHFCGDKDRQRRVYCHVIEEAAKLAVCPGTTRAEDDVVDCDLAVVICCGWNNVPKTGDKCTAMRRRSLVNLCSELQLLRHWEQDAVDMRTLLQIASGWANACSETSLWARGHDEKKIPLWWLPRRLVQTYCREDHRVRRHAGYFAREFDRTLVDDGQQYAEFCNFASTQSVNLFREYVKPCHRADVWRCLHM